MPIDGVSPIEAFSSLRNRCRALREVFVPDEIWASFEAWHLRPDDFAGHQSVLLLALSRGCLNRITQPVHRYLLPAGTPSDGGTSSQYIQDLKEKWMLS